MISTEEFIKRAAEAHNNKYDYSLSNYLGSHSKIVIVCPEHGEFEQTATNHLSGRGCRKCGRKKSEAGRKSSDNEFISKSKIVHGNKYDYSVVDYIDRNTPVVIICLEHGEFEQSPHNHIYGKGCQKCGKDVLRKDINEFVSESLEVHGDKFDYSKANYHNSYSKVVIICPEHGEFKQTPDIHLRSTVGCPSCVSKISVPHQNIIDMFPSDVKLSINDRKIFKDYEVDIHVSDFNFGIEIHGCYWHGLRQNNVLWHDSLKKKHLRKSEEAENRNYSLVQFWDCEIRDNGLIISSMISNKLGLSKRIYARKCSINKRSNEDVKKFVNSSHIQGHRNSLINLTLEIDGDIVAYLSFSKNKKYQWEIMRFCNKLGHNVVGGFSRLLNFFVREFKPDKIMTFADRRYSLGNLYRTNGFNYIGSTKPNYFYYKAKSKYSRQQFQKHKLHKKLPIFDPGLTETENMLMNGFVKVYDAGHHQFLWSDQF